MSEIATVIDGDADASPLSPLALIQQAIAKGVSPEQLGRFFDLQERYERNQANLAFNRAMARVQEVLPPVVKDRKNEHSGRMYATLETVLTTIQPTYSAEGFSLSFLEEADAPPGFTRLACDVSHSEGCTRRYSADLPNDGGNKQMTPIQAKGSTISYAKRYLVCMIFNVNVADEDRDGNPPPPTITGKQMLEINDYVARCGRAGRPVNESKFLEWCQVDRLENLPASKFPVVVAYLKRKVRGEQ